MTISCNFCSDIFACSSITYDSVADGVKFPSCLFSEENTASFMRLLKADGLDAFKPRAARAGQPPPPAALGRAGAPRGDRRVRTARTAVSNCQREAEQLDAQIEDLQVNQLFYFLPLYP